MCDVDVWTPGNTANPNGQMFPFPGMTSTVGGASKQGGQSRERVEK